MKQAKSEKFWRRPLDTDRIRVPHGVVQLIAERCKGCGFCIEFCPQQVLCLSQQTNSKGYHLPEITDTAHCLNCGLCMLLCPDFAIYVKEDERQLPEAPESNSSADLKQCVFKKAY